jgi:8-oxo-dGTP pyrophosphatase MutT (NUDIX family)
MAEELGRPVQGRPVAHNNLRLFKACGAFLLANDTKRSLFLLRSDDTHTNTWGLVGGKVEDDESVMQALEREILEETGHAVKITKSIPLELFRSEDGNFEYHTFVCLIDHEFIPLLSSEHSGYAWSHIKNFPKPLHPGLWSSLSNQDIQHKLNTMMDVLEVA